MALRVGAGCLELSLQQVCQSGWPAFRRSAASRV